MIFRHPHDLVRTKLRTNGDLTMRCRIDRLDPRFREEDEKFEC